MGHHLIIYTRISTKDQTPDAQDGALSDWIKTIPHDTSTALADQCSGSVTWRQRDLRRALEYHERPATLIVSEITRLGRSTLDVLDFLAEARRVDLTVRAMKGNFTVDDSISGKILTTILALVGEIERDFIRARTREGLKAAAAAGRKGGRPSGPSKTHSLDPKAEEIARLLAARVGKRAIARVVGVSRNTLYRYLARTHAQRDLFNDSEGAAPLPLPETNDAQTSLPV
jgi:DNA invertase Pin-like site-specific DNA recombinase